MTRSNSYKRCGIVLAGGKGRRLRPFIHRLKGGTLPKQYVNFIGRRSMLEHTLARAERVISRELLFTVITGHHLNYREAQQQLARRFPGTVIVQPTSRDTGPGMLLPLMHLCKRHPDATVAIFPSDHFILEEDVFMAHVGMAFYLVESHPSRLVLLGIEPDSAESEYGYILPDGEAPELAPSGAREVGVFVEKPDPATARRLIAGGGLWNSMIMVFKPETVLDLLRRFVPRLYLGSQEIFKAIGTRHERAVIDEVYRRTAPINFSKEVLEAGAMARPSRMSVLAVSGVLWSDWGSEERVLNCLTQAGYIDRLLPVADDRISPAG
ncbi:MAG TPA: sugar phosphate nucleotidyltransferase [Candidatus Binatia bacterium]|jgi:mannose-1-phosphate guanylyltransferase